jgi:hypothetical protein
MRSTARDFQHDAVYTEELEKARPDSPVALGARRLWPWGTRMHSMYPAAPTRPGIARPRRKRAAEAAVSASWLRRNEANWADVQRTEKREYCRADTALVAERHAILRQAAAELRRGAERREDNGGGIASPTQARSRSCSCTLMATVATRACGAGVQRKRLLRRCTRAARHTAPSRRGVGQWA